MQTLYYGDNGIHEFWQDAAGDHCIIRNHGEKWWVCVMLSGQASPRDVARTKTVKQDLRFQTFYGLSAKTATSLIARIKKQYRIALTLDESQRWRGKGNMTLAEAA